MPAISKSQKDAKNRKKILTSVQEKQYKHILESEIAMERSIKSSKRIAMATVKKSEGKKGN